MPANAASRPSTLLDDGFFVVSYDLPLEHAYAILPQLNNPRSQGEPALLDCRASTDLDRTNSAFLSSTITPEISTANEAQVEGFSAHPTGRVTFNFEQAEFKAIDLDEFRKEALMKTVRTELRHVAINRTNHTVASYVWHSAVAPDLSEVPAPQTWKSIVKGRAPSLLFMTWPQVEDTKIWFYSPELRWESVKVGDEFALDHDTSEWTKDAGEYSVEVEKNHAVELILKDSKRRYGA